MRILLLFIVVATIVHAQTYRSIFYQGNTHCDGQIQRRTANMKYCRPAAGFYYGVTCNQTHVTIHKKCESSTCTTRCISDHYKFGVCYKWGPYPEKHSQLFLNCEF
jgi:hypothetical protein